MRSKAARAILRLLFVTVYAIAGVVIVAGANDTSANISINFQNPTAAVPLGYLRDSGDAYGVRTGANQGSGSLSYGWVALGTTTPIDLTSQGRERDQNTADQRLDTLIHMQANNVESAWEIELPNGPYDVTVTVGDSFVGSSPDEHAIRIEGVTVINRFVASGSNGTYSRHKTVATQATVSDGKLTIDALAGVNTKINYVDITKIEPGSRARPEVTGITPASGSTGVARNSNVVVTVRVPNGGINGNTVTPNTVRLIRLTDGALIQGNLNTSGGGDEVSLTISGYLDPATPYRFDITDGVQDVYGMRFIPFSGTFATGTSGGPTGSSSTVAFEQTKNVASGKFFSSIAIGPDGKLYAATLTGEIMRYTIDPNNGTLSNAQTINTIKTAEGGNRAVTGLAFDPSATSSNIILWVSHNGPYVESDAPDWSGKVSRLSGINLSTKKDYVINLPHSFKDHMVNSLTFGPDKRLYLSVGSNSAMGSPDAAWGERPERLLSASILRITPSAITNPPLNVKTEDGGSYNPFATNAPLKIYATGVRNAYDLVWHTNGQLYAPGNGSAAGGNTPDVPETLPASCNQRIDGKPYSGPSGIPGLTGVSTSNDDYLFRVVQNGYYGHPNPLRCEWIMNGGNPTNGKDSYETKQYPVGTMPDSNYRGISYNFGPHVSPNGVIEYRSNTFDGKLKGKLLVMRYSLEDDIIVLTPGGTSKNIVGAQENVPGFSGFNNPLDITENRANGDLYVVEFGPPGTITLLRPLGSTIPQINVSPQRVIATDIKDDAISIPATVTINNTGNATLSINNMSIIGPGANQFQIVGTPIYPLSIAVGASATVKVGMKASTLGPTGALLQISSNDPRLPVSETTLRGLGVQGTGGTNEPSLQWVLDTYELPINIGDDNSSTNVINSNNDKQRAPLIGDEVSIQKFQRADNANPVLIEPLSVFGPTGANPVVKFGWYESGNAAARNELFSVSNSPTSNAQRLNPLLNPNATLNFDPGETSFGFYSTWPFFDNRTVLSEDALNSFDGAIPHHVRVYQLRDAQGAVVPNAYVVAMEEHISGFDYQDVVVIVRNVKTATPMTNAPTANAGIDQTVNAGTQVVLAGSGSDLDGDILTYNWQQTGGTPVILDGSDSIRTFTPIVPGTYVFTLMVTDPNGLRGSDEVVITVISSLENQRPEANAGRNLIVLVDTPVMLNGSGIDPEGSPLTYIWQQIDGSPITLADGNANPIVFQAPSTPTVLRFSLTVVDNIGLTSTADMVEVVVTDEPLEIYIPLVSQN